MKNIFFITLLLVSLASCQSSNGSDSLQSDVAAERNTDLIHADLGKACWLTGMWESDRGTRLNIERMGTDLAFKFVNAASTEDARLYYSAEKQLIFEQNNQKWQIVWTGEKDIRMEPFGKNNSTPITWVRLDNERFLIVHEGMDHEKPEIFSQKNEITP